MRLPDPHRVRSPAVAGLFYPGDPQALEPAVRSYIEGARAAAGWPKAVIAPHAGYDYSGPIAGTAFRPWAGTPPETTPHRIVLLGPAHRVALDGLAAPASGWLATPLGRVEVDRELVAALDGLPQVIVDDLPHLEEHSLEVELPFLQVLFDRISVLPLVVGRATPEDVAQVLERVWGGPETLIVISSDLSHYLDYATARERDLATAEAILAFREPLSPASACGAAAIDGLLVCARRRDLEARLVDLRSSGDTAGDRRRVVGYGAFHFFEIRRDGSELLDVARRALEKALDPGSETALGSAREDQPSAPELRAPGACFVTLRSGEALRGCIGTVHPYRPLAEDVAANARAAALDDPRFPPLTAEELASLSVEVSVLSPLSPLPVANEPELFAELRPGRDGLCVEAEGRRALFLPQVWETLPEPAQFIARLLAKAGLEPGIWPPGIRWSRFTVTHWEGPARRAPEA